MFKKQATISLKNMNMCQDSSLYWSRVRRTRMGLYLAGVQFDELNRIFKSDMSWKNDPYILDLCSGDGKFSLIFLNSSKSRSIFACDKAYYGLNKIKTESNNKIHTIGADLDNLPFREKSFDYIVCIEGICYSRNVPLLIRELHKILKKDGYLIFDLGNKKSYKSFIYKKILSRSKFYRYSYKELKKILNEYFIIKKEIGYNWLPFGRASNSLLIPIFAYIERLFLLKKFVSFSPYTLYICKKKENDD